MASTSQKDIPRAIFPCVCFHQTEELSGDADVVANARDIFVKFCPKSVKIVKKIFSILPLKEDKKETRCRWIIVYCQDDGAQLSIDEVVYEIRTANMQDTRIIKEVPFYVDKRLHIGVEYLVTTCRYYRSRTGAISRSTVPEHYKSGESLLTDSTRLEAIEYIINNIQDPVKEMCLMLELNHCKKEQLDNWLVEAFQDCLPEHFDLLARYEREIRLCMTHPRHDEYPTLLHCAANFGLEKFALQILERPGSAIAWDITNKYDLSPVDSAENEGHLELAMMIKRYTSLDLLSNMHSKLEEVYRKVLEMGEDITIGSEDFGDLHKVFFPFDYFYKSTLSSVQPQSLQPTIQKDSGCANSDGTYSDDIFPSQNLNLLLKFGPIELLPTTEQSEAPCIDDELTMPKQFLGILSYFCDNKLSDANDWGKLVEDWNNRNNVQKSFEEKKEQLKEMGLRYEKLEMKMKKYIEELKIFDVTQDEKEISSPSTDFMHFQEPVNTWDSPTSSEMTRTIMKVGEDFYAPMSSIFFNLFENFISDVINAVVTDDKNKITDNVNKATNNDINIAHDDKNETTDIDVSTDDKNEASDDVNVATDNMNEAANDKNEATDDVNVATYDINVATDDINKATDDKNEANDNMNEAIEDMNEATHDKNEITDDKNEANDYMNKVIDDIDEATHDMNEATDSKNETIEDKNKANDDMNEATHDKNEATDDNRVENTSCTIS